MKYKSEFAEQVPFSEIGGVSAGNAENLSAKTGVTVFFFPSGARAAVDVSGGGPASCGTSTLGVSRNDVPLDALVFGGGSAFGLEASAGVMRCLEEHGKGLDTGAAVVPIVAQSDIYDLSYGSADIRPDAAMGYEACMKALSGSDIRSGNAGAGTGATVGKACGMERSQKSGIGYGAFRLGSLIVGACAVVNAFGDIFDSGEKIAGMTTGDRSGFSSAEDAMYDADHSGNLFLEGTNTTIGAVFTNAALTREELYKTAQMARSAYARCISPVGTMADGDTIYALSLKENAVRADINVVGTLAARALEAAVLDAVRSAAIPEGEFLSCLPKA